MFLIEINVFVLVPRFGHSLYAQVRTRSVRRPRLHRPDQDRRLLRKEEEAKRQRRHERKQLGVKAIKLSFVADVPTP